jgi:arabinofuranosyltransferase
VYWIGGDFMRGRFFSWDVLLCSIIFFYTPFTQTTPWRTWINTRTLLISFALLLTTVFWEPPVITPLVWGTKPFAQPDSIDGVTQERHFYFWFTSLYRYLEKGNTLLLDHGWCQDSIEQQRQQLHVAAANTMGFRGYCLGTQDIVVDMLGITDPLLARMPKNPTHTNWRPGHFHRLLPSGYCASIADGTNHISDPLLHDFYDKIRLLTQSRTLFSIERLQAIWDMNTGVYNDELQQIQQAMLYQYETTDGNAWQIAARKECPVVELQPDVIEKLKHVGEGE